jgi:hypothetical protein
MTYHKSITRFYAVAVGSAGIVLHVEMGVNAPAVVVGAVPLIVTALTRTGMTAPVERLKAWWFKTAIKRLVHLFAKMIITKLTSQKASNLPRVTCN